MPYCLCALLMLVVCAGQSIKPDVSSASGFHLPAGFSIVEVAGPELANDIYCLTISPQGEIVVSGRGYIKQLIDDNADGVFDRAVTIADHPRDGAMGLHFSEGYLYFMGDGGLRRFPWKPGALTASSELLLKLKTGGEHDAHAISRGPDGWLYLLCGNMSAIRPEQTVLPGQAPKRHTAGGVLRVSPDFKTSEMICDGFRNAYGFDWSLQGELYTYDSDNERCMGLPWYEGCRFYRIERGGHYGWRSPQLGQFWRLPPYHPDVVPPLLDLGRGSPTGVVCYRHQQFPAEYRGNFFLLDWTFGNIHAVKLNGDQAESRLFLKVAPGHGFAPTAACIHPLTGDLYVSSGGRGTRGAVYRIRHEAGFKALPADASMQKPPLHASSRTLRERKLFQGTRVVSPLETLCHMLKQSGELHASSPDYAFKEGYELTTGKLPIEQVSNRQEVLKIARALYPSADAALNRELVRSFALMREDDPASITRLLQQITSNSSPVEDTHILFALACTPAKRTEAQRLAIADALVQLEYKYNSAQITRERHWDLRLSEAVRAHLDLDPELAQTLLHHPGFKHPHHLNYLADSRLPGRELAGLYRQRALTDPELEWSSRLVEILSHDADPQILTLLRKKWDDPSLRDAILPVIAKSATEADRPLLYGALRQLSRDAVKQVLDAIDKLSPPTAATLQQELIALVQAMKTWGTSAPDLVPLLRKRLLSIAQSAKSDTMTAATPEQLEKWVIENYPETKRSFASSDGVDLEAWKQEHQNIPWQTARPAEGERHFKKLCAACHQGSGALGPDLAGIGKRFSRDDLLTAIVQPSKDVSARYRTSVYVTEDGQTHVGLVIYEAIDGIILQTGASTSVRISGKQIAGKRTSDQSLMPAGLLDKLSQQEIADLIGWLQR